MYKAKYINNEEHKVFLVVISLFLVETVVKESMYTVMLVEVVFIERVANKTSTNILIYILLSILLRLTGTRDRLIGCIEKESILGKDISTCLPVSLNARDLLTVAFLARPVLGLPTVNRSLETGTLSG